MRAKAGRNPLVPGRNPGGDGFETFFVHIRQHQACAGIGEMPGDNDADAACRTGDDDNLVGKSRIHLIAIFL